jgi:acetolactate synthase I/II/III large subunit
MGWDMPGVVGACIANGRKETILVTGDGSIQFNIQELNTISHNKLPVKIFVLNNNGYESIRATQNNFFHGNLIGADPGSGVGNPDFASLAKSYKFSYISIKNNDEINEKLKQVFSMPGPVLCELNISPDQARTPKVMSVRKEDGTMESRPLEDQFPFIPREELARNMNMFPNQ